MKTRELWLLRHGKSLRNCALEDFDRPLKKRGELAALRIGLWLKQEDLVPDYIVSSPANRALATASKLHKALDTIKPEIITDPRLYAQGVTTIKILLGEIPAEFNKVLLVGHNPELEDLLSFLVGFHNLPQVDKLLPTATAARLAMPLDWTSLNPECATLLSINYAKSLIVKDIE